MSELLHIPWYTFRKRIDQYWLTCILVRIARYRKKEVYPFRNYMACYSFAVISKNSILYDFKLFFFVVHNVYQFQAFDSDSQWF